MPIINCTGCHVGELTTLDGLWETLRDFPLPGDQQMQGIPKVKRLRRNGADGVTGEIKVGRGDMTIKIRTNPKDKSAQITIDGPEFLEPDYKRTIREYLSKRYGPEKTLIN